MENESIKCTVQDIQRMQEVFEKNNSEILECLNKINKELEEMPNVLSTPNSNKIIPEFLNYGKNRYKFVSESSELFKKRFELIINEYSSFMEEVKDSIEKNK